MFKNLTIKLATTLCECSSKPGKLPDWGVEGSPGNLIFFVRCPDCKVKITVPFDKVTAGFKYLDQECKVLEVKKEESTNRLDNIEV